jgi:hypothetical protein
LAPTAADQLLLLFDKKKSVLNKTILVTGAVLLAGAALAAAEPDGRTWSFDKDTAGQIAAGFVGEVGRWTVVASDRGQALAQTAKNEKPIFNLALVIGTAAQDVDVSVRLKAVAGEIDQGGGLVWRAKDGKNYYLARYNPLEDNFRLYTVVDGTRTQLKNADIPHVDGWQTLRVVMRGAHIECYYDGRKYLEADDATFAAAGQIGLWSKADAQSQFDDLTLAGK